RHFPMPHHSPKKPCYLASPLHVQLTVKKHHPLTHRTSLNHNRQRRKPLNHRNPAPNQNRRLSLSPSPSPRHHHNTPPRDTKHHSIPSSKTLRPKMPPNNRPGNKRLQTPNPRRWKWFVAPGQKS